jgi:NTE family protein
MSAVHAPRIGLALGSGSARGWAHVGVIRELENTGIKPSIVCGTSIGALVGAAYAAGEIDRFEQWVRGMRIADVLAFMDLSVGGGLLKGERLMGFLRENFVDRPVERLPMPFGAVATALRTGAEVWLREGSTVDAVRASIALPGLLSPVLRDDGTVLVDGGLVNPVPVSLARAMGADVVIAVDLGSDILGRHLRTNASEAPAGDVGNWLRKLQDNLGALLPARSPSEPRLPSLFEVVATSINIMQVRIARSRMAGEPADLVVAPRLSHLGLLDFQRADEAIEEGRHAVRRVAHDLPALASPGLAG